MQESLSERVSKYRKRLGYTQETFAALFNTNRTTYATWEQKGKFPNEILVQMAEHFGISLEKLLEGTSVEKAVIPLFYPEVDETPQRLHDNPSTISLDPPSDLELDATDKSLIRIMHSLNKEDRKSVLNLANDLYHKNITK